jgi:hypothetical protein
VRFTIAKMKQERFTIAASILQMKQERCHVRFTIAKMKQERFTIAASILQMKQERCHVRFTIAKTKRVRFTFAASILQMKQERCHVRFTIAASVPTSDETRTGICPLIGTHSMSRLLHLLLQHWRYGRLECFFNRRNYFCKPTFVVLR